MNQVDLVEFGHDLLWLPEDLASMGDVDILDWINKQTERQKLLKHQLEMGGKAMIASVPDIKLLVWANGWGDNAAEGLAITSTNRIVLFSVKDAESGDRIIIRPWPRHRSKLAMHDSKYTMGTLSVELIPLISTIYRAYLEDGNVVPLDLFPNIPLWVGFGDWPSILANV